MSRVIDAETFGRRRQEQMLRTQDDRGLVERSQRPRYVRSGTGYRFIPAGGYLFEVRAEAARVA